MRIFGLLLVLSLASCAPAGLKSLLFTNSAQLPANVGWYKNIDGSQYAEAFVYDNGNSLILYVDAIRPIEHTFPPPISYCIFAETMVMKGQWNSNGYPLSFATHSNLNPENSISAVDGILDYNAGKLLGWLDVTVTTPCGVDTIKYQLELDYVADSSPNASIGNSSRISPSILRRYIP